MIWFEDKGGKWTVRGYRQRVGWEKTVGWKMGGWRVSEGGAGGGGRDV